MIESEVSNYLPQSLGYVLDGLSFYLPIIGGFCKLVI